MGLKRCGGDMTMAGVVRLLSLAMATGGMLTMAVVYGQERGTLLPPAPQALDLLNLRLEWSVRLPMEVNRDAISQFQTIDDQIFIQTRTGLLFALDARSGQIQWQKQLGNGGFTATQPLAANKSFVFVTHLTRLYAFHRYSGVSEFEVDMGSNASAGLAADESGVYCILGLRSGNSAAYRLTVYNLLSPIRIAEKQRIGPIDPANPQLKDQTPRPLDDLMRRYAPRTIEMASEEIPLLRRTVPNLAEPVGGYSGSRTPSLSILPRITPPYTLTNENYTPSLNVLPSLRQPYRLRDEASKYLQRTPSIGTIPPSVAAALALTDLRPQPIQPPVRWEYGLRGRIEYPALLTPQRVWIFADPRYLYALNKRDRTLEVSDSFSEHFTAAPVHAAGTLYIPIARALLAVDAARGSTASGVDLLWRTPLPGDNNHSPLVTQKYVYVSGYQTGVICLQRSDGRVLWRSDASIDTVVAANDEFVYARDSLGNLHVFSAGPFGQAREEPTRPLASLPARDFDTTAINTVSDRLYLVHHSGLIVCLRNKDAKYRLPVPVWPTSADQSKTAEPKTGEPKSDQPPSP